MLPISKSVLLKEAICERAQFYWVIILGHSQRDRARDKAPDWWRIRNISASHPVVKSVVSPIQFLLALFLPLMFAALCGGRGRSVGRARDSW